MRFYAEKAKLCGKMRYVQHLKTTLANYKLLKFSGRFCLTREWVRMLVEGIEKVTWTKFQMAAESVSILKKYKN